MKTQDWSKFLELIQATDELMTGKPRSETAIKLLFYDLRDRELSDIVQAVNECRKSHKFNTNIKPADILEKLDMATGDQSALAWRLFLRAVDRHGVYDSIRFPHPAFHYAIEQLGGWERVSAEYIELTDHERQFREKDFRQFFEIGLRVATWDNTRQHLPGFYERDNLSRGYHDALPGVVDASTGREIQREALGLEAPKRQNDDMASLVTGVAGALKA